MTSRATLAFLSHLRSLDIKLWVEEDRLRYNAPPKAFTPAIRAELVERKAEILEFLQEAVTASHFRVLPTTPVNRDRPLALSFAQQRLWFLHQLLPDSAAYNVPIAIRLIGRLEITTLEQCLREIVHRHETLRTTFTMVEERPVQVIHHESKSQKAWDVQVTDLQDLPQIERNRTALRLASRELQRPFELEQGPLLRTSLWRLSQDEHLLLFTVHHIVFDGWSVGLFFDELTQLYQAYTSAKPAALPTLSIQYADFAAWQRESLRDEQLKSQLNSWARRLKGSPATTQLPTDRPRPAVQTFRGTHQTFTLPRTVIDGLAILSRQEETTLFITLLAAFKLLLYRYTGQTDVVVGSPIANRNHSEIENLIGFFVNTLVLRTDLSGNPTFLELLSRVREISIEAYAHQDLPFERLVEILQPERNLSQQPLFQVMFVLQNAPFKTLELPGLTLTPVLVDSGAVKFDLSLILEENPTGLSGIVEYSTDLFDSTTIARMIQHFQTLLEEIVANPSRGILDLSLLTTAEQREIVVEWNETQTIYPQPDLWIHQRFEAQAFLTPDAPALIFEQLSLSYRQLNQRANQLAHFLIAQGVSPDLPVGVCLERSLDLVIALLAILKAGGAYIPLDPSLPRQRLLFMLSDAQVSLLLTQQQLLSALPDQHTPTLCLDSQAHLFNQLSSANPGVALNGHHLAYTIYTSGSTGNPKGAMNSHQAILNRLLWMQHTFRLTSDDRVLQKTPFSFDVSVWEFFWPLISGACLVVARPEGHKDSAYLLDLIAQQQISTLHFVPSMLQAFLLEPDLHRCRHLRQLICSGEALSFDLQQRFFARFPAPVALHNLYGPTEAAIDVTFWSCQRQPDHHTVPIGKPIANTQMYVLDPHLQPLPVGVSGELYIGGLNLARGYHRRPALTAERFIPNPYGQAGSRLYRTGDLARYRPDGTLEYLGRTDFQVKIRGFRIELGEIEAALTQHPAILEAVVIAQDRKSSAGGKWLVAYIVRDKTDETNSTESGLPDSSELRQFLQPKLPDYMIPGAFIELEAIPLSPSGKADRRLLPEPELNRRVKTSTFVKPRSETEAQLAEIWADLLGLEEVGIRDNFFGLGGDSILGMQIIARANQAGMKLSPRQLFQYQTIAELAPVVQFEPLSEVEQGPVSGLVPLLPVQHWFFEQQLANPHHWNQAMLLEFKQPLQANLLRQVIAHLIRHHDALRLRFSRTENGWQQLSAAPNEVDTPFSSIDLAAHKPSGTGNRALAKIIGQLQAGLNISTGPLLQAVLIRFGAKQPDHLLLIIHHLAVDGVSWRILLEDIQRLYQQLSRDEVIQLPPKSTSYKQWSETVSQYARSHTFEPEVTYWLGGNWQHAASLPLDFSEEPDDNIEASTGMVSVALDADQTRRLLQEVHAAYQTQINDILLSALALAVCQWSPSMANAPLLLDLEGHGREDLVNGVDLSRTVGWFTAIFPVLLELEGQTEPGEVIKSVKEQLRQIPKHGIGYGLLRYLGSGTDTAGDTIPEQLCALPQAEILFNYLGQFDQTLPRDTLFSLSHESTEPNRSPDARRRYRLEIDATVIGGQLQLDWAYSHSHYHRVTVQKLANAYINALQMLIAHCQEPQAGGYTPSDFPEANLSQSDLDDLLLELDEVPE